MGMLDRLKADLAAIYGGESFAEAVTLRPAGGIATTVKAFVVRRDAITAREPGQVDMTTVAIQAADLPTPLVPYDKIETSDGIIWTVQPGAVLSAAQWVYPVTSSHRMDGRAGA